MFLVLKILNVQIYYSVPMLFFFISQDSAQKMFDTWCFWKINSKKTNIILEIKKKSSC